MTQNQIAYHNAKENERHNRMMEQENQRHQMADESIRQNANRIQAMTNYINAVHYGRMDTESQRSHLANEYLTAAQNQETSRHNLATEALTRSLNNSLIRKNLAGASYASANAGYIQERTRTQAEETRAQGYQADILGVQAQYAPNIESSKAKKALADVSVEQARGQLLGAQANVQWTYGLKNFTGAIHDAASSVQIVTRSAGDIFGYLFGDAGKSTLNQEMNDWYNSSKQGTSADQDPLAAYMNGQIDVETYLQTQ